MIDRKGAQSSSVEFFRVSRWSFSFSGEGSVSVDLAKNTLTIKGKRTWGGHRYFLILLSLWLIGLVSLFVLALLGTVFESGGLIRLSGNLSTFLGRSIVYLILFGPFIAYALSWILNFGKQKEKEIDAKKVSRYGHYEDIFKLKFGFLVPYVICFELPKENDEEIRNALQQLFQQRSI